MSRKVQQDYKIKRNKYYTITIIIITIFVIFEIICNMEYFLNLIKDYRRKGTNIELEIAKEVVFSEKKEENMAGEGQQVEADSMICYLYADAENEQIKENCVSLLKNQKRDYQVLEQLQELEEIKEKKDSPVFVAQKIIDSQELEMLQKFVEEGCSVVFLSLPDKSSMKQKELQEFLGIWKLGEKAVHEGVCFVPSFFVTDELLELEEIKIEMFDCQLAAKTKTFAYSLIKEEKGKSNLETEMQPPILWRNSLKTGYVYSVNGNLQELSCMPGVVTALLSEMIEDDIYPVVNGYSVAVKGLPYIYEKDNAKIIELYSRDAMGLQQDILFPALISSAKKNSYIPTFFADMGKEDKKIETYVKKQIEYMQKEIVASAAEIGLFYCGEAQEVKAFEAGKSLFQETGIALSDEIQEAYDTIVSMEDDRKLFIDQKHKTVRIPIVRRDMYEEEAERLKELSYVTECALLTTVIDISSVLECKEESYDWIRYDKQCETVFATHNEYYKPLSRLTIKKLSERILLYSAIEPVITKKEEYIEVEIRNFAGEAYFMLRTDKTIKKIENGESEQLGSNAYLIRAEQEKIIIHLEKEDDAL